MLSGAAQLLGIPPDEFFDILHGIREGSRLSPVNVIEDHHNSRSQSAMKPRGKETVTVTVTDCLF
jgi:hypothetical protein